MILAFYASRFNFNGISSYEKGLMIYDFSSLASQENSKISSSVTKIQDKISRRYDSLLYGVTQNDSLKYKLVFGTDNLTGNQIPFGRYDIQDVADWLTRVSGFEWLEIEQADMENVRYKCTISDLEVIQIGNESYGYSCVVETDSPFAYLFPETHTYTTTALQGSQTISILSKASNIGYYYPSSMTITLPAGVTSIKLKNITDNNHEMIFTGFTNVSGITINIDNLNQIVTSSTGNMYQYFNFNFFRLLRGDNSILISGASSVSVICEFPVNVGG